jgi:hypothetical protein
MTGFLPELRSYQGRSGGQTTALGAAAATRQQDTAWDRQGSVLVGCWVPEVVAEAVEVGPKHWRGGLLSLVRWLQPTSAAAG